MNGILEFEPLDSRIVDGSFYLARTRDGYLHAAARFDGEWRYSRRGQAVRGVVTEYVWSPAAIARHTGPYETASQRQQGRACAWEAKLNDQREDNSQAGCAAEVASLAR